MRTMIALIVVCISFLPVHALGKIGGGDITFRPDGAKNVVYSHDLHAGRLGLKCTECHPRIFAMAEGYGKTTMASMEKGQSCGACHNGERAFSVKTPGACVKCHVP